MSTTITDLCMDQAQAAFREVNNNFLAFVRELGGADHLPKKFTLNVPAMRALEAAIDKATADGNLQKTEDLCDEYRARFKAYLDKWREQIQRKAAA